MYLIKTIKNKKKQIETLPNFTIEGIYPHQMFCLLWQIDLFLAQKH